MTRGVAAFDFDGTITKRDTLVPFLRSRGWGKLARAMGTGGLWAWARNPSEGRNHAKERVLRSLFEGVDRAHLDAAGTAYSTTLPARYRPEALERIKWHRTKGHDLVLVSASLGVYARPAAKALGFNHVIAVELQADAFGRLTGQMEGPNVRGPEKARRLQQYLGSEEAEIWAYGDSDGDKELLEMAHHPAWVGWDTQDRTP